MKWFPWFMVTWMVVASGYGAIVQNDYASATFYLLGAFLWRHYAIDRREDA